MFVAVAPAGINGFDYLWLGFAIAFDLAGWLGGAYTNRDRVPGYRG
jgi:hypothetical protein